MVFENFNEFSALTFYFNSGILYLSEFLQKGEKLWKNRKELRLYMTFQATEDVLLQ